MFARDWECCFIELRGGIMTITEDLHMLLYVALGGALGSVGRYLVAGSLKGVGGTDFGSLSNFGVLKCLCTPGEDMH